VDSVQALAHFEKACRSGVIASCFSAASMYRNRNNPVLADERFQDGCALRRRNEQTNAAYFAAQAMGNTASPDGCPQ
jgi:TPR repeat protein